MTRRTQFALSTAAIAAVVIAACTTAPSATLDAPEAHAAHAQADARPADAGAGANVNRDLAALRAAMAKYQRIEVATASEYPTAITPCWYHGDLGAMGYHYADPNRIDTTIEPLRPEALLYEPLPGGKYKLVAVEYIVPIAAWTGAKPPELYGRPFDRLDALGLYALHAWIFRDNPEGMFTGWNPKVSCEHAAESEDRGVTH